MPKNQIRRYLGQATIRVKNQNFWNPTNYIPLEPEFYADHYSQKDVLKIGWDYFTNFTLKSKFNKDMTRIRLSSDKLLESIICIITLYRSNFKTIMTIFFSCRPVYFASISALCGIECNKWCVKQGNLVTSCKNCFLLAKLVTTTFFWKKSIIE